MPTFDEVLFANYVAARQIEEDVDNLIRVLNTRPGVSASEEVVALLCLLRISAQRLRDELKQQWADF